MEISDLYLELLRELRMGRPSARRGSREEKRPDNLQRLGLAGLRSTLPSDSQTLAIARLSSSRVHPNPRHRGPPTRTAIERGDQRVTRID